MHCGLAHRDRRGRSGSGAMMQSLITCAGAMKLDEALGKPSVVRAFLRVRKQSEEDKLMRISILATIFAFGTVIALPAQAQQSTGTSSQQQTQDEADKGIKTRNSGESGYVGEQERPGASSHIPGQPDTKSSQTTTGTGSSARETGGKAGGVSVGEQEKKPVTNPATSQPR
jgi:hypothetical protein